MTPSDDKELMGKIAEYLNAPLKILRASADLLAKGGGPRSPRRQQEIHDIVRHNVHLLEQRIEELLWMMQIGLHQMAPLLDSPHKKGGLDVTNDPLVAISGRDVAHRAPPAAGAPPKILVVDDDPLVGKIIEGILKPHRYQILQARSGDAAVDLARLHAPALITMDVLMPKLDGREVVRVLREDPETKGIPIVVLSASEEEERFADLRVDNFLKKPVNEEQLLQTVERILSLGQRSEPAKEKVLIVDDSLSVVKILTQMLRNMGYATLEAFNGTEALALANREQPNLIILDFLLHRNFDGLEVLSRLKTGMTTSHIPVILLSAKESPEDKAEGLKRGADDFITKPCSPLELGARVEMILRRTELEYCASPTTRLPGNIAIERVIAQRVASGVPFAVCYADLDNFKSYNDTYGFSKGDGVIRQTARILTETAKQHGNPDDFVGHIGGDDYIVVTTPDKVDRVCRETIKSFDKLIPLYYDEEARRRGYIQERDRQGRMARFPLMTLSIAVVTNVNRKITHAAEVADIAAELKRIAKKTPGSVYVKDRRKGSK